MWGWAVAKSHILHLLRFWGPSPGNRTFTRPHGMNSVPQLTHSLYSQLTFFQNLWLQGVKTSFQRVAINSSPASVHQGLPYGHDLCLWILSSLTLHWLQQTTGWERDCDKMPSGHVTEALWTQSEGRSSFWFLWTGLGFSSLFPAFHAAKSGFEILSSPTTITPGRILFFTTHHQRHSSLPAVPAQLQPL